MADDIKLPTPEEIDEAFKAAGTDPIVAPSPQIQPTPPPAVTSGPVNVLNPSGELVSIPSEQLQDAMASGYMEATPEAVQKYENEQKYGGLGQQILTGVEGAASAATFGLSTGLERALGVKPEAIQARREVNPSSHMIGEVAGLGASLFTGVGEGALLGKAGQAVTKAILPVAETTLSKIGSAAVTGAVENALFQSGDEVSKMISNDPAQSVETAIANIGLSAALGGVFSGGLGAVNPLWEATIGSKVGGVLSGVAKKMGGIEGVLDDPMERAILKSGMELKPEIKAGLANDPAIQEMFKVLEQSDTTSSGRQLQESFNGFRRQAGEEMAKSLGAESPELLKGIGEISKAEAGKKIGNILAKEYQAQLDPVIDVYEGYRKKYGNIPLKATKEQIDQTVIKESLAEGKSLAEAEALSLDKIPGTVDKMVEDIGLLAQKEQWHLSPSSPIMKEVNRVIHELPNVTSLNELNGYIKQIGVNMQSNPLDREMIRAGTLIKGVLRDSESEILSKAVGVEEGALAEGTFNQARKAYAAQGQLKDAIEASLHARGSVGGYAKALREMASSDSEILLRRIADTNDVALLNLIKEKFPKTSELIKKYHVENLLGQAVDKAGPHETLSASKLLGSLNKLSPEMRNFIMNEGAQIRINAIGDMLEHFKQSAHNFSNTGRTVDKLLQYVPASAVGAVSLMLSHNPVSSLILAGLTKVLAKDVPDAMRLSVLKFLGSRKPINATGFAAMVDSINNVINGERISNRAIKNIFKANDKVLPQSYMPSEKERNKLDKAIKNFQKNPSDLFSVGGHIGHYLPDQAVALGSTAATAVQYLQNLIPNEDKMGPLGDKAVPSSLEKAHYNQALNIAQSPLSILEKVKDGSVTVDDITHLSSMYPNLYSALTQKLTNQIAEITAKGGSIPYSTRIGLSLFVAQPLDDTMKPESILAAQPKPQQNQQSSAMQPASNPKHSMTALNKLPKQYATPNQSAEAANSQRKA